jgi:hypothetical protein
MTARRTPLEPPSRWDRWTHFSHRYVLPVAAGTAVTFGAALLADYQPAVLDVLPAVLIAVGGVALATSFGFLVSRRRVALRHLPTAPGEKARDQPLRSPFSRAGPVDLPPVDRLGTPWPIAFAKTDTSRGSLASSSPGEQLWHEWLSTQAEGLGAEIVGPVPATAYSERSARAPDPFPYRDEDLLFLEQLAEAAEGDEAPGAMALAGRDGWATGSLAAPDISRGIVEVEAMTAVPPYLRSARAPERRPSPAVEMAPAIAPRSRASESCSTCLVTLEGSRWHPCPGCFQPICPDCVVDSLASYGATGCAGCVQGRPIGM